MKRKIKFVDRIIGAIVGMIAMLLRGVRSEPITALGVNDDCVLKPLTIRETSFFAGRIHLYLIRDHSIDNLSIKISTSNVNILHHRHLSTMKEFILNVAMKRKSLLTVDDMYYTTQTNAKCEYKYKRLLAKYSTYITIDSVASNVSGAPYVFNSSFRLYPSIDELKVVGIPCMLLDNAVIDTAMCDTYISDLMTYSIHAYDKKIKEINAQYCQINL